jgi:hypothetical protein
VRRFGTGTRSAQVLPWGHLPQARFAAGTAAVDIVAAGIVVVAGTAAEDTAAEDTAAEGIAVAGTAAALRTKLEVVPEVLVHFRHTR